MSVPEPSSGREESDSRYTFHDLLQDVPLSVGEDDAPKPYITCVDFWGESLRSCYQRYGIDTIAQTAISTSAHLMASSFTSFLYPDKSNQIPLPSYSRRASSLPS